MEDGVEYYWKKNSGPPSEKNQQKDHLIDFKLRFMKSYGTIIKTCHMVDTPGAWTKEELDEKEKTVFNQDFLPFLQYSKNKKRRWLLEDEIGPDLISDLQNLNDNKDVVVLKRVYLGIYPFHFICWGQTWIDFSKIGSVYRLVNVPDERPAYIEKTVKRKGNMYDSIIPKKKVDKKNEDLDVTICYNFFIPPPSYKKMLHHSYCSNFWNFDRPANEYYYRKERMRMNYVEIEQEVLNSYCGFDLLEDIYSGYNWEDDELEEIEKPTRYYDLMEHFVDKFVIIKRNKKRRL